MKKGLFLLILFVALGPNEILRSQNFRMCLPSGNESVNTCTDNFYDSGGPSGNYSNNNNCTYTFCADQPGQCIVVNFNSFQVNDIFLGIAFDYLDVYDGSSVAGGTYMFTISGGAIPAPFPVASSTGCLTFDFTSDASVRDAGWNSAISCQPCPLPANPAQQDCSGSIAVCEEQYYQPFSFVGNNGSNIIPPASCLTDGELNNSWYVFTAQTSEALSFVITPNLGDDDYDWAVFDISNNGCSGISTGASPQVSCNYSGDVDTWSGQTGAFSGAPYLGSSNNQGASGTAFNSSIPVTAGNTYALVISNFSNSQDGYYLDLTSSGATLFDNSAPVLESVISPDCGTTQVIVNFSEPTLCSSIQANDFTITGPGGPYTITSVNASSCTGNGVQFTQTAVLTVSSPLLQSGTYQVCLTSATGGISDLCENSATSGCFNVNLSSSLVALAGVDQTICTSGATVNLGENPAAIGGSGGYSYLWSPATGIQSGQNTPSAVVSPPSTTTYTLLVTDALGCQASDDVQIIVPPPPAAAAISYNTPFCTNVSAAQLVNLQGSEGGTFGATPMGLTINPISGAINPSTSTAGIYTVNYTLTPVGACPAVIVTTTVQITNIPPAPGVSPSTPCAGQVSNFTATGSAWVGFTLNGTEVQAPSSDNTWSSPALVAGDQVCVTAHPPIPFTFNGLISEPQWGNALANSAGGPISGFGSGNAVDALYLKNQSGYLFGAVAGRVEDNVNNNKILVFLDTKLGGYNNLASWTNRNGIYFSIKNLDGGVTFDAGFEPDYIVGMNYAGATAFFDLYDMQAGSNTFLGTNLSSTLLGYTANSGVGDYTKGFEFALPLASIGNPSGSIKTFVMLVNDPGAAAATTISNQFLTPAGAADGNYGNGAVNFNFAVPNPINYSLSAACSTQTCITVSPLPNATVSGDTEICSGESTTLNLSSNLTGTTFSWTVNQTNATGATNGAGPTINQTLTATGTSNGSVTYTFTPNSGGCNGNPVNSTITITPLPTLTPIFHE